MEIFKMIIGFFSSCYVSYVGTVKEIIQIVTNDPDMIAFATGYISNLLLVTFVANLLIYKGGFIRTMFSIGLNIYVFIFNALWLLITNDGSELKGIIIFIFVMLMSVVSASYDSEVVERGIRNSKDDEDED